MSKKFFFFRFLFGCVNVSNEGNLLPERKLVHARTGVAVCNRALLVYACTILIVVSVRISIGRRPAFFAVATDEPGGRVCPVALTFVNTCCRMEVCDDVQNYDSRRYLAVSFARQMACATSTRKSRLWLQPWMLPLPLLLLREKSGTYSRGLRHPLSSQLTRIWQRENADCVLYEDRRRESRTLWLLLLSSSSSHRERGLWIPQLSLSFRTWFRNRVAFPFFNTPSNPVVRKFPIERRFVFTQRWQNRVERRLVPGMGKERERDRFGIENAAMFVSCFIGPFLSYRKQKEYVTSQD